MNTLLSQIEDRLDAMKELNKGSSEVVINILMDYDYIVLDLNTEEQLRHGKYSDGTSLPDYSFVSVNVYGKPAGAIKLYDEGDFYDGFNLKKQGKDTAVISSSDSKAQKLEMRFGDKIYGLTPENFIEVRDFYVLEEMIDRLKATQK